jgi:hypothetical protein
MHDMGKFRYSSCYLWLYFFCVLFSLSGVRRPSDEVDRKHAGETRIMYICTYGNCIHMYAHAHTYKHAYTYAYVDDKLAPSGPQQFYHREGWANVLSIFFKDLKPFVFFPCFHHSEDLVHANPIKHASL